MATINRTSIKQCMGNTLIKTEEIMFPHAEFFRLADSRSCLCQQTEQWMEIHGQGPLNSTYYFPGLRPWRAGRSPVWIFSKCGRVTHTASADTSECGDLWPRDVVSMNTAGFDLCCKGLGEKEAKSVTMHKCCNPTEEMPLLHGQLRAGPPQQGGVYTVFSNKLEITAEGAFAWNCIWTAFWAPA